MASDTRPGSGREWMEPRMDVHQAHVDDFEGNVEDADHIGFDE